MCKRILFILSTLALLMHPLFLSAQVAMSPSADFDGDGQVGFSDFLAFVSHFGSRQGDEKYEVKYDLDSDGAIEFSDFLIFISSFGKEVFSGEDAMPVDIPDANLRAVIADSLGKASGAPIVRGEMATLTRLEAPNANIRDLTGLEFATRLTRLDLGVKRIAGRFVNSNRVSDLSPLSGLTSLERLYLTENRVSDLLPLSGLDSLEILRLSENSISEVSALSGLTSLEWLYLADNSISDLSPLSGLANLEGLGLASNSISDITPLSGLDSLEAVSLVGNSISDLSPLSSLTNLEWLGLSENSISDITPLSGLTKMEVLGLSENSISDITPLSGLTSLRGLWLDKNNISDLSPLVDNTGLSRGDVVDVRDNPLSDTSINTHIPTLEGAGVQVRFSASKPTVGKTEQDIFREMMELLRIEERQAGDYIYHRWMEEEKDVISSK